MAPTTSGGIVLGSAAVIGLAVNGSVLLFATLSMAIVLFARARERRLLLGRYGRRSLSTGRQSNFSPDAFQAIPEHAMDQEQLFRSSRSPERWRQDIFIRRQHRGRPPLLGGLHASARHPAAAAASRGGRRLPSLSWPLSAHHNPLPMPAASFQGIRLKPLPPIVEHFGAKLVAGMTSPAKRLSWSMSRPSKPTQRSAVDAVRGPFSTDSEPELQPGSSRPVLGSGENGPHTSSPSGCDDAKSMAAGVGGVPGRMFRLQRSKSDGYRPLGFAPMGGESGTPYGTAPRRPGLRSCSLSLHQQSPGLTPQRPVPPLPAIVNGAWRTEASLLRMLPDQSMASPGSLASVNSSILDLACSPPPPLRLASNASEKAPAPSFSSSSRSSDQLSSVNDENVGWDNAQPTGLTSPSRRQRSQYFQCQGGSAGFACPDPEKRAVGGDDRFISHRSRVSLEIVGRRDTLSPPTERRAEADAEDRDSLSSIAPATAIDLTPPPAPPPPLAIVKRTYSSSEGDNPSRSVQQQSSTCSNTAYDESPAHITPLQIVSGNQLDPFNTRSQGSYGSASHHAGSGGDMAALKMHRPAPLAMPVSALKPSGPRKPGHKRQKCVRISNLEPIILGPGSCSTIYEESRSSTPESPTRSANGASSTESRPLPRPPSRRLFDPQITPTPLGTTSTRAAHLSGELVSPSRLSEPADRTRPILGGHQYLERRATLANHSGTGPNSSPSALRSHSGRFSPSRHSRDAGISGSSGYASFSSYLPRPISTSSSSSPFSFSPLSGNALRTPTPALFNSGGSGGGDGGRLSGTSGTATTMTTAAAAAHLKGIKEPSPPRAAAFVAFDATRFSIGSTPPSSAASERVWPLPPVGGGLSPSTAVRAARAARVARSPALRNVHHDSGFAGRHGASSTNKARHDDESPQPSAGTATAAAATTTTTARNSIIFDEKAIRMDFSASRGAGMAQAANNAGSRGSSPFDMGDAPPTPSPPSRRRRMRLPSILPSGLGLGLGFGLGLVPQSRQAPTADPSSPSSPSPPPPSPPQPPQPQLPLTSNEAAHNPRVSSGALASPVPMQRDRKKLPPGMAVAVRSSKFFEMPRPRTGHTAVAATASSSPGAGDHECITTRSSSLAAAAAFSSVAAAQGAEGRNNSYSVSAAEGVADSVASRNNSVRPTLTSPNATPIGLGLFLELPPPAARVARSQAHNSTSPAMNSHADGMSTPTVTATTTAVTANTPGKRRKGSADAVPGARATSPTDDAANVAAAAGPGGRAPPPPSLTPTDYYDQKGFLRS